MLDIGKTKPPFSSASPMARVRRERKSLTKIRRSIMNVFFPTHTHTGEDESKHVMRTEIVTSLNALLDAAQPAQR